MEFWAQRTVSPADGRVGWTVVDDAYVEHEKAATWLRVLLDAQGRSVGTAQTYAGRLALYLTWAAAAGADPVAPTVDGLARFARWLERTPSRKHRPGRHRRRAADPNVVGLGPARSAGTVEGILAAVVEFVRFCASRGWCEPAVAERLSFRTELAFAPSGWDRGERAGRPVVDRRVVRRRRVQRPPDTLTCDEVGALVDACSNRRDRFIVEALYASGLRVAELCGLRLTDLHLVPSATHLGCPVEGAHLHVVRREDNDNGALAKSIWPRVVPVTKAFVACHDAYRFERDAVAEAAESDYLFVNLWRAPIGHAMSCGAVDRLFVRLSAKVGFRARPHMLRHSFASEVALLTKDPALVKELLGHASVSSTHVYLHARWSDMRAAVDGQARTEHTGS
ncbi:MAG: tyrosine-type recombinase/integrase [Actinomycetota bacterium]|nr:tyrosine-type recombinase/integrase [Actinomycetota bacterium]